MEELLDLLKQNARLSNEQLAVMLGDTPQGIANKIEEYEKKYGWDANVIVDGWSEDNYIIKYFCKSLTGYMRNYIRDSKIKPKDCLICGENIPNRNTYCNDCYKVYRRNYKTKKQQQYRKINKIVDS